MYPIGFFPKYSRKNIFQLILKIDRRDSASYHEDNQIERLNLNDTNTTMTGRQKIIGLVVLLKFCLINFWCRQV